MTHNHQARTGKRIAEKIFADRATAESFVAECRSSGDLPNYPGHAIRVAHASQREAVVLASGRVEEIDGRFHARFNY